MDEAAIRSWFDQYLAALAVCGRGESDDLDALLEYYGVPLLVATDDAAQALTTAGDVTGFARRQVQGMRAASYDHSETIRVTYLITNGPGGLRISALAVHGP